MIMRVVILLLAVGFFCGSAKGQDQPEPTLESSLMPTYPVIAAMAHIEGDVRASFVVDAEGAVVSVDITSGPQLLTRATVSNIRSWKFRPAAQKSAASRTYDTVFYYRISPRNACDSNRWVTVSTGSFHAVEITVEVPLVESISDSTTGKSSH
jgi:TonB family protein